MKKIIFYIIIVISLSSCESEAELNYNKRSWELKQMNEELEYLQNLYNFRDRIQSDKYIKTLDSLIQKQENNVK